jgi:hypothetical protein
VSSSTADTPSSVPGTLIITLGLAIRPRSPEAASIEPPESWARRGSSSKETKPSAPPASSKTGRNTSAAIVTSARARSQKTSIGDRLALSVMARIASS